MTKKIDPLIEEAFQHGLTVGVWAGSGINKSKILKLFRQGKLPRTMAALNTLEQELAMQCPQHPNYQAKRPPKSCTECWYIYRRKNKV